MAVANRLLDILRSAGLEPETQKIAYKVAVGGMVLHVLKSALRVDLKGFDELVDGPQLRNARRVIERLDRDSASKRHLGKVSRQILFNTDEDLAFTVFHACVRQLANAHQGAVVGGSPPQVTITLQLPKDLLDAVENERRKIEHKLKGIEVSRESAIRALLHEAIDARQNQRSDT